MIDPFPRERTVTRTIRVNKAYDEVLEFKMRMTVPNTEPVHYKHDLVLRVTAVETQAIPY